MPHWICKLPDDAIIALMLVGVAGATDAALLAMRHAGHFQAPSERRPSFWGIIAAQDWRSTRVDRVYADLSRAVRAITPANPQV